MLSFILISKYAAIREDIPPFRFDISFPPFASLRSFLEPPVRIFVRQSPDLSTRGPRVILVVEFLFVRAVATVSVTWIVSLHEALRV